MQLQIYKIRKIENKKQCYAMLPQLTFKINEKRSKKQLKVNSLQLLHLSTI